MWLLSLSIDTRICHGWRVSVCTDNTNPVYVWTLPLHIWQHNIPRYYSSPHCVTVPKFSGVVMKEGIDHRIVKVGKDLYNHPAVKVEPPSCPPLNHVLLCHYHTFFKHFQGWWFHHFPGQPVLMLCNPLNEEIFSNIHSKCGATWSHFLLCCHLLPGRRNKSSVGYMLHSGGCRGW